MKKNLSLFIVTLLVTLSLCMAQTESSLAQKIVENSKATWEAYKSRNVSALKEHAADDYASFAVTGPSNLQQDIAGLTDKSITIEAYTITDPKVTMATKDVALLRYKCELNGTIQGKPLKPAYVTEVWVNRGGKWKIVSYQETPL
jgi:ketosteroid isomerase-like protein